MTTNFFSWLRRGRKTDHSKLRASRLKPDFEVLEFRSSAAETLGMGISVMAMANAGALAQMADVLAPPPRFCPV